MKSVVVRWGTVLALATVLVNSGCGQPQTPAEYKAGSCLVQNGDSETRVRSRKHGYELQLPSRGWTVDCGAPPRIFYAHKKSIGLHLSGEVLGFDASNAPPSTKVLRSVYALVQEQSHKTGTRLGEPELKSYENGDATLTYNVWLEPENTPEKEKTDIRSIRAHKLIPTTSGKLFLLNISWTGTGERYEGAKQQVALSMASLAKLMSSSQVLSEGIVAREVSASR